MPVLQVSYSFPQGFPQVMNSFPQAYYYKPLQTLHNLSNLWKTIPVENYLIYSPLQEHRIKTPPTRPFHRFELDSVRV